MIHLFNVQEALQLEGPGCVLVPGIPNDPTVPVIKRGAPIVWRTPFVSGIRKSQIATEAQGVFRESGLKPAFSRRDMAGTVIYLGSSTGALSISTLSEKQPNSRLFQSRPGPDTLRLKHVFSQTHDRRSDRSGRDCSAAASAGA